MSEKQPHIQLSSEIGISKAIFVGDPKRLDVLKAFLRDAQELAYNREFRSISGSYEDIKILGLSTGVGAPSAAIAMEEASQIGIKEVIRVGSSGAYQSGIGIGDLVIATAAVRSDGLSKNYVPEEFPAVASLELLMRAKKFAKNAFYGIIRSHDGFYNDENLKTETFWSKKGILAGDMESSSLMTVGFMRGVKVMSILNNVVVWQSDLKEGVNNLVNSGKDAAQGERESLLLALKILTEKEAK